MEQVVNYKLYIYNHQKRLLWYCDRDKTFSS